MTATATLPKISRRTASGEDKRGNARNRAARKNWMLATWGDGEKCDCVHCGTPLSYETVQADRIAPGGSYARKNVQPSCAGCNRSRSNNTAWVSPLMAQLARSANATAASLKEQGK
jgi:5-methylcytosine-specific restriction endonuclease McrA